MLPTNIKVIDTRCGGKVERLSLFFVGPGPKYEQNQPSAIIHLKTPEWLNSLALKCGLNIWLPISGHLVKDFYIPKNSLHGLVGQQIWSNNFTHIHMCSTS